MTGFQDLTNLLQENPDHRIVVVREDGTPVGVLLSLDTYRQHNPHAESPVEKERSLVDRVNQEIAAWKDEEATKMVVPTVTAVATPHQEWDQLMEKVGEKENEKTEETYLFEPVE